MEIVKKKLFQKIQYINSFLHFNIHKEILYADNKFKILHTINEKY